MTKEEFENRFKGAKEFYEYICKEMPEFRNRFTKAFAHDITRLICQYLGI
jgi:hypothetical protein